MSHKKLHGLGNTSDHTPTTIDGINQLIVAGEIESKFRGWDRLNPSSMGDINYDLATRTFSISPKSGEPNFYFFVDGDRFTKATTQSVQWPDETNTYYFYFNPDGELHWAINGTIPIETFIRIAVCGLIYYNKEDNLMLYAPDEQHGIPPYGLVPMDHVKQHLTIGFVHSHGGQLLDVADGNTHHGKITSSLHFDEDIPCYTDEITGGVPWCYRDGLSGGWVLSDPDTRVTLMNWDTGVSVYNEYDETSGWVLTDSDSDTDFMIEYLIKTNFNIPYMKVCAQQVYPTIGTARSAIAADMERLKMDGMAGQELEFQYAWIGKKNGVLKADDDGKLLIILKGQN